MADFWLVAKIVLLVLLLIAYIWVCLALFTLGIVPYKVYYWLTRNESLARDLALLTFALSAPAFYFFTVFFKELYEKGKEQ